MTSIHQPKQEPWDSLAPTASPPFHFTLQLSERRVLLLFFDFLLLNLALISSLVLKMDYFPTSLEALWQVKKWFLVLAGVWFVISATFDLYNLARSASTTASLQTIIPANVLIAIAYLLIPRLTPPLEHRSQMFLFVLLAATLPAGWRVFYAQVFVQPAFLRRVLVAGAGCSGQALVKILRDPNISHDNNPFRGTGQILIGFVDDNPALSNKFIEGLPVLGNSHQLPALVRQNHINEIIIAITHPHQIEPQLFEAILDCCEMGITVTNMTTVYERLTGRVAIEHASRDIATVTGRDDGTWWRLFNLLKRLADICGGLVGLLVMLLLVPPILLGNQLTAPGPLFFQQTRIGKGGKAFMVIKFRSMVVDAEKNGAKWASKADPRITKIGHLLRATHLDELPQAWNVLRGEMSLIGPRPERPEFVCQLSRQIPFYRARHGVRPGITGWAQIHQDYGDSLEGAKEKLEYDLYYLKHASPLLDTLITLRTIAKIIGLRGR